MKLEYVENYHILCNVVPSYLDRRKVDDYEKNVSGFKS